MRSKGPLSVLLHIPTMHGSLFSLLIYFPSNGKCMYFTSWKTGLKIQLTIFSYLL